MTEIREMADSFEAKKIAQTQDKNGYILKLVIHPNDIPEAVLRDFVGQRYMVSLVRMNDEDEPVPSADLAEGLKAVKVAGALCSDGRFQEWLFNNGDIPAINETLAVDFVRKFCGVKSRAELKTSSGARQRLYALRDEFVGALRQGGRVG